MTAVRRVVIVGASTAGLSTAEALRAEGFDGEITLVGDEAHAPYARPPLSKQALLGDRPAEQSPLCTPAELGRLGVELRTATRATALDVEHREVVTTAGPLPFDVAVVATGSRVRRPARLEGALVLRTLDDARTLRGAFESGAPVAIVGGGVLAGELASAARRLGLDVSIVSRSPALAIGGPRGLLARRLVQLHRANGVHLHLGARVRRITAGRGSSLLELDDGARVPAGTIVAATGSAPAVGWLGTSGLDVSDGVVCDGAGLAAPGVYAVGDVAAWREVPHARPLRIEHQLAAIERAQAVAHHIVTGETSPAVVPFFWTEIHGTRIQSAGPTAGGRLSVVDGDPAGDRFVAVTQLDGQVAGVLAWNDARGFTRARRLLGRPRHAVTDVA